MEHQRTGAPLNKTREEQMEPVGIGIIGSGSRGQEDMHATVGLKEVTR